MYMKFIRDTNWQEVSEGWRSREADNPGWIECATKIKGWADWESWRNFTAEQIGAKNRGWKIFQFPNPLEEIPQMLIGPYSGWQSRVENKNSTSFADLLELPDQLAEWRNNSGVLKILNALPFATEMIGLKRMDNNKIVCIDGHHRAVAISLAKRQNKTIDFTNTPVMIDLTELEVDDCHLLDAVLRRGTVKDSPIETV